MGFKRLIYTDHRTPGDSTECAMKHPKRQHELDAKDQDLLDSVGFMEPSVPHVRRGRVSLVLDAEGTGMCPPDGMSESTLRRRLQWLLDNGYLEPKPKTRGWRPLRVADDLIRLMKDALKKQ